MNRTIYDSNHQKEMPFIFTLGTQLFQELSPKIELEKDAYDEWVKTQRKMQSQEESQKLDKFQAKISKANEIKLMQEEELSSKQKLRIQTQLIKESIHNEQQLKLQKIQKQEYAKLQHL
ncbi:unnamed protein product (macronuclear) [Paramecium tetraurelia]|uniref:Uncharacterized protein n=1 Tax=Paramecium tetraurelia TaxID=5888 RepID=A0BFD3_PARTE|nr:uncharacterized protein GSPATT00028285001 [Paramecium tetraurelia]CAK57250.1 unnamed protein product [Paramecium tetraurelia]|eukprot:XP_001424648.1 hypothetical protein (macronuclear) [Paramecium tetraurelia strain d4-2]